MICNHLEFFIVACLCFFSDANADCAIEPTSHSGPLIITTNGTEVLYPPHGSRTLPIRFGRKVDFVCPGGIVRLGGETTGSMVATATCISNTKFAINGKQYSWLQVTCSRTSVATARKTGKNCVDGEEAEIGFNLGSNRFVRMIYVCYDSISQITLYTQYEVIASIGTQITGTPRPTFRENPSFYEVGGQAVNTLYLRNNQRRTINELLGLSDTNTKYIKDDALHFLARGHMAARSDFFYPAQQNATFQYINCAPQWQTFNGFNWARAETSTRNYASRNNVNLQVYTGVYGVTSLPHSRDHHSVKLYLYSSGHHHGIPVPAIYWKVVYEPISKRGVALIGVNNPYETSVSQYVYCKDVSSRLSWLLWNRTSIERGYSYACTIADLRNTVNYVPKLNVTGLLI